MSRCPDRIRCSTASRVPDLVVVGHHVDARQGDVPAGRGHRRDPGGNLREHRRRSHAPDENQPVDLHVDEPAQQVVTGAAVATPVGQHCSKTLAVQD